MKLFYISTGIFKFGLGFCLRLYLLCGPLLSLIMTIVRGNRCLILFLTALPGIIMVDNCFTGTRKIYDIVLFVQKCLIFNFNDFVYLSYFMNTIALQVLKSVLCQVSNWCKIRPKMCVSSVYLGHASFFLLIFVYFCFPGYVFCSLYMKCCIGLSSPGGYTFGVSNEVSYGF